jgi:hypothetical protein
LISPPIIPSFIDSIFNPFWWKTQVQSQKTWSVCQRNFVVHIAIYSHKVFSHKLTVRYVYYEATLLYLDSKRTITFFSVGKSFVFFEPLIFPKWIYLLDRWSYIHLQNREGKDIFFSSLPLIKELNVKVWVAAEPRPFQIYSGKLPCCVYLEITYF